MRAQQPPTHFSASTYLRIRERDVTIGNRVTKHGLILRNQGGGREGGLCDSGGLEGGVPNPGGLLALKHSALN